jgi:hypothetical protein
VAVDGWQVCWTKDLFFIFLITSPTAPRVGAAGGISLGFGSRGMEPSSKACF